ncbi:MAG: HEAT repeat domain-containing protein [Phycisphaerae bacterium]|nr:HEAT repeat domain-containing protein [Phycisphaerae bacterium]
MLRESRAAPDRARVVALGARAILVGVFAPLLVCGCAQMSSDVNDFSSSIFPPSPSEAARWAVDNTNPENQRRGVMLLGTSSFGGDPAYIQLYTLYIEENSDPLVKAAAIQALARHGDPASARLIARQLESPFTQVRLAAARGLQRVHNPAVADSMWKHLVNPEEDSDIRVELAIALGQYPRDDVFQALCTALDQRELAVNLAAADSLRLLTAEDYSLERGMWLGWYRTQRAPFRREVPYYYPTFQRSLGLGDYLMFWSIPTFEEPGVPAGMTVAHVDTTVAPATSSTVAPPAPATPPPPAAPK